MKNRSGLIWTLVVLVVLLGGVGVWLHAQSAGDPVVEAFKIVEVASVADAIEQLYGTKNYMSQDMRPLFKTKFAGRAVTVGLTKYENKEGGGPTTPMIEAIDTGPVGSVYVMAVEDGASYGVIGGLMGTTLKFRGVVGAVVDGSARDLPQLNRLQFPVFSRGVSPGTTVGHYRATRNVAGHLRRREGQSWRHHLGRRRRRGGDPQGQGGRDSEEGAGAGFHRALHLPLHRADQVPGGSRQEVRPDLIPADRSKAVESASACSAASTWVLHFSTTARRRQRPCRSR